MMAWLSSLDLSGTTFVTNLGVLYWVPTLNTLTQYP